MVQLTLWPENPATRSSKTTVFRVFIKDKLYTRRGGELLEEWIETTDFVLFTADGQVTTEEFEADYVMARRQCIRIQYAVWRAHSPELYDKEKLFEIDAGHAHESKDAVIWKKFTADNNVTAIKTETHHRYLSEAVRG